MKKIKNLLLVLLIMIVAFPFGVIADEENKEEKKEPVNVYLFRSNSCHYCEAAMEWFDSIEEEYGDYFDLVDYEVSTQENSELWSEVAEFMGDTASGVPYMVVGEYTYPNGFAADTVISSTSDETMGDQLIERIMEIYESDNRYDVMVEINNKPDYSSVVGIVAVAIITGLVVMAIITRKQSR